MICLPYAGGSSMAYFKWIEKLKDICEVIVVDYLGHGSKTNQACANTYVEMLDDVYREIIEKVKDKEFVIFGHSMGAYVAFSLCEMLAKSSRKLPISIILSSANAPDHIRKISFISELSGRVDWDIIERLGGTPKEILSNKKYREYFEPLFFNDFKILESITITSSSIRIPFYVIWGNSDLIVTRPGVNEWNKLSYCQIEFKEFKGGHFYCFDENNHEFWNYLRNILCKIER